MKKILITGATGFVAKYLIDELYNEDVKLYGTTLDTDIYSDDRIDLYQIDLTDNYSINKLISEIKPDEVYHLASQSSVKLSWDKPQLTSEVNIIGAINILESLRTNNIQARVLLIGSSEEYGSTFKTDSCPTEDIKCVPENFYAISKYTQGLIGSLYCKAYGMNIMMTRSFNHIGPGQSPQFVMSDFAKQIAEIKLGEKEPKIYVGNLKSARDFLDVRDVIKAYVKIMETGKSGETYNVGSGESFKIQELLELAIKTSGINIDIVIDENKFRTIDIEETKADISKLKRDTNWEKKYDISGTIANMIDYWVLEKEKSRQLRKVKK